MKKTAFLFTLLLSNCAFATEFHYNDIEEKVFSSNKNIYETKLNRKNVFQAQLHDYFNYTLKECGLKKLDKNYWGWGGYQSVGKENKELLCKSLSQDPINVTCRQEGILGNHHGREIGYKFSYIFSNKKRVNKDEEYKGDISCHINDTFRKHNSEMILHLTYNRKNILESNMIQMPHPRKKGIFFTVANAHLTPNAKDLKVRYETVVILD